MRALLFLAAAVALLYVAQAQVPCDTPFQRLLFGRDWAFAYRAFAALEQNNNICPAIANTQSCCDGIVYDALAQGWVKLYGEVVAIKTRLGILQIEVDILLAEISVAKQDVANSPNLTPSEKTAITNFLNAVASAVSQLVPNINANFVKCYSVVLRFYAGMLCRACDPTWNDWVILNGSNPENSTFELLFAQKTCTTFQDDCYPFFAPFFTFADALLAATEALASTIPDNATRQAVLSRLESFNPPCIDNNDCLLFICYRFLVGLDRLETWAEGSFSNATISGGRRFVTDSAMSGLNRVQRSAVGVVRSLRSTSPLNGQNYGGTFDPLVEVTNLNTNAGSSSSSMRKSFWTDLFL